MIIKKKKNRIIIPKEKAVFWLDGNGRWRNEHGEFKRKKIIDFFHASIRRDKQGYHVTQQREQIREKVYFSYEDTALFVFDLSIDKTIVLVLNTTETIKLKPKNLFIKNDGLYMRRGKEIIKFNDRSLMKISPLLEDINDQYYIRIKGKQYRIDEKEDP